jgi:hypothetical protein
LEYNYEGFQIAFFIYLYVSQFIESMKYLKTLDFAGQTFIFAAFIIGSLWIGLADGKWSSLGLTTAFAMLCLGWWQMISALIMLVTNAPFRKQRLTHFITALVYLGVLALSAKYMEGYQTAFAIKLIGGIIMIGTPVALAIFYYVITCRWVFPAKPSGKFLPHVSF